MTNVDKIRSMSDEELAEFIRDYDSCACCIFDFKSDDCYKKPCEGGIWEWLKREVDEDVIGCKGACEK